MKFDQTADLSNKELYSFLSIKDIPDFVKHAALDTSEDLMYFDKTAFADEISKSFPINNPARVYVSNAYFINKKAELIKRYGHTYADKVETKIKKAAELFKISDEIEKYNNFNLVKKADDTGIEKISVNQDDIEVNLFFIKTAEEFSESMAVFVKNINKYPLDWRFKIASSFVDLTDKYNVDSVPDLIAKYAGLYFPDVTNMQQVLRQRASKIEDSKLVEKYSHCIQELKSVESVSQVFEILKKANEIEIESGILFNDKVAHTLGDIVDRVFTLSLEKVSSILNQVKLGDNYYDIEKLSNVSPEIYKEAFGIDVNPKDTNSLREILSTMPRSDVELFKEIARI